MTPYPAQDAEAIRRGYEQYAPLSVPPGDVLRSQIQADLAAGRAAPQHRAGGRCLRSGGSALYRHPRDWLHRLEPGGLGSRPDARAAVVRPALLATGNRPPGEPGPDGATPGQWPALQRRTAGGRCHLADPTGPDVGRRLPRRYGGSA